MTIKKKPKNNGFNLDEYVRRKKIKIKSKQTRLSIREAEEIIESSNVVYESRIVDNVLLYHSVDY
jgi:hypothetical protein